MKKSEIEDHEYADYYSGYVAKAPDLDLNKALEESHQQTLEVFSNLTQAQWQHRYEADKWTVAQILQHIIDAERVFSYRALRFARKDMVDLPGYDQDQYALQADTEVRDPAKLLEEYKAVRHATQYLYSSFDAKKLRRMGSASGYSMSARALGFIIAGHEIHHLEILKERYGI